MNDAMIEVSSPAIAPAFGRRSVRLVLLVATAAACGACTPGPPEAPAGTATAPVAATVVRPPAPASAVGATATAATTGSSAASVDATTVAAPSLAAANGTGMGTGRAPATTTASTILATPVTRGAPAEASGAPPDASAAPPTPPSATHAATAAPAPPTPPASLPPPAPAPLLGDAPGTLAGVHFAGDRYAAADVFGGGPGQTGWTVELAYASDGAPDAVARRMTALYRRGFRVILRVDYARGQHIPPAADPAAVAGYVDFIVKAVGAADGRVRHVVVGNEGNIDEAGDDPARNTECRLGRATCAPEAYAAVYTAVRDALRPRGDVAVLVAGVSPGDADHPARWMSGPDHLAAVLARLGPGDVDGVALHAYGLEQAPVPGLPAEPLAYFQALVERQLEVMAAAGHARTPVYITEMNAYTRPEATFVRAAYAWLNGLNRAGRARIRAACWFVLDGGGAWSDVALAGRPDILAVFREVAQRYPPGR